MVRTVTTSHDDYHHHLNTYKMLNVERATRQGKEMTGNEQGLETQSVSSR